MGVGFVTNSLACSLLSHYSVTLVTLEYIVAQLSSHRNPTHNAIPNRLFPIIHVICTSTSSKEFVSLKPVLRCTSVVNVVAIACSLVIRLLSALFWRGRLWTHDSHHEFKFPRFINVNTNELVNECTQPSMTNIEERYVVKLVQRNHSTYPSLILLSPCP
jgi:hypothetical protein